MADVGVIIGQLTCLIGNRFGDFLTAIADIHAVKSGKRIQQLVAVAILNMATAGSADDTGRGLTAGVLGQMGRRVKEVLAVPLGKLVIL